MQSAFGKQLRQSCPAAKTDESTILHAQDIVNQIGVAPNRIDILTSIDGVEFDEAWQSRKQTPIDGYPFSVLVESNC